jgi:DNA-binding PadR family transcriptional regulator
VSIDYTILGVLIEAPTHGYSIKKYLLENVSRDFGVNDGQLYPALGRLEARGWISKRVVPQRRSPTKHLYRATPAGERAFYAWLEAEDAGEDGARYDFYWKHEFLQRLTFFRYLGAGRASRQIGRAIQEAERRVADLARVNAQLDASCRDPYRRMIADYGLRYQRMRLEWLRALEQLAAGAPAADVGDVRVEPGRATMGEPNVQFGGGGSAQAERAGVHLRQEHRDRGVPGSHAEEAGARRRSGRRRQDGAGQSRGARARDAHDPTPVLRGAR